MMAVGNSTFHPSVIEDRIYKLMENPEYIAAIDTFTTDLEDVVYEMLDKEFPNIEWQAFSASYPNNLEGTVSLSWIEDRHLHLIGWDWIYV